MKTSEKENIHSELREQIITRAIAPGTKLLLTSLSRKWNISRTPIREALRQLESEDLVIYQRSKGFVVSTITIEDIIEIYTIRVSLESLAGKLATPIISKNSQKLKHLEQLCTEMGTLCEKRDIETYGLKNKDFHLSIWNSSENAWLIKILENLNSQVSRFILKVFEVPSRIS